MQPVAEIMRCIAEPQTLDPLIHEPKKLHNMPVSDGMNSYQGFLAKKPMQSF